ncbi:hypothetical protein A2U01_0002310 [Trifolium medium]|uniref:Uncharacterized protein n=1 Tax=Trifolium medium TaxID=97028 RepID=A0A392M2M7_9FABA|nr:hypothetical protein [Trifolium medium]
MNPNFFNIVQRGENPNVKQQEIGNKREESERNNEIIAYLKASRESRREIPRGTDAREEPFFNPLAYGDCVCDVLCD